MTYIRWSIDLHKITRKVVPMTVLQSSCLTGWERELVSSSGVEGDDERGWVERGGFSR